MKADLTRSTFRPEKHYSGVRMQQGRVQLDADWNEQADIETHRVETGAADLAGSGAPLRTAGFLIADSISSLPAAQQALAKQYEPLAAGDFYISAGRYYVDGVLCECESPVPFSRQPDAFGVRPEGKGTYLAYLDVWRRHITALDDPGILETALGGPDTATRVKTVWQVRLLALKDANSSCGSVIPEWSLLTAQARGSLSARAKPSDGSGDACIIAPGAGYRRIENQLYRVEIHQGGALGAATFKWSRDNGSIVTAWLGKSGNDLTVAGTGKDRTLSFAAGDWVELTDDSRELDASPGTLVKLTRVASDTVEIDPQTATGSVDIADFPRNPKVRRWNTAGSSAAVPVAVPSGNDGYVELEDGVEVKFEAGDYRSGDYWTIPARTATGSIEWDFRAPRPPEGIFHGFVRLGILSFDGSRFTAIRDCRVLFPAVTDLTSLFYVGGEGQEGAPGQLLPAPLQVGAANGRWPLKGAAVRFSVTGGSGKLQNGAAVFDAATGGDGIASCTWSLDSATPLQQVTAVLLDASGAVSHLPIRFSAAVSRDAKDPGIHVSKMLLGDGTTLENDADVAVSRFLKGVQAVCDADVEQEAARNRPVFSLTLELPFPFTDADRKSLGAELIGFQPIVLAGEAGASGAVISWKAAPELEAFLQKRLFDELAASKRAPRVLVRLALRGHFIWQAKKPGMQLDGDVFGTPIAAAGVSRTAIALPSGDGRRGGTLEMWFWLTPSVSVSIAPASAQARAGQALRFVVSVAGTSNTRVSLAVNGIPNGSPAVGIVRAVNEAAGEYLYTAPPRLTEISVVRIVAASEADPSQTATASVILIENLPIPGAGEPRSDPRKRKPKPE